MEQLLAFSAFDEWKVFLSQSQEPESKTPKKLAGGWRALILVQFYL
jgi:hypothetical protein